jgi:tetratricopeptide (TPR) repeat protein
MQLRPVPDNKMNYSSETAKFLQMFFLCFAPATIVLALFLISEPLLLETVSESSSESSILRVWNRLSQQSEDSHKKGRTRAAAKIIDKAIALADVNEAPYEDRLVLHEKAADYCLFLDEIPIASSHLERAVIFARWLGDESQVEYLLIKLADTVSRKLADIPRAIEHLEEAKRSSQKRLGRNNENELVSIDLELARLLIAVNRLDDAERILSRLILESNPDSYSRHDLAIAHWYKSLLEERKGRVRNALRHLQIADSIASGSWLPRTILDSLKADLARLVSRQ